MPAKTPSGLSIGTILKMKRSRKDLAIQKLFPDYDWSLKNIEGDLGQKFKAESQFNH